MPTGGWSGPTEECTSFSRQQATFAQRQRWRLSRIGTVGVSADSSNTLWNRLRQHHGNVRGKYAGGGNHRGSIFRLHVGRALIEKHGWHDEYPHWGEQNPDAETTAVREQEHELEQRVSEYIRDLPFLWVDVPGDPGPECVRAVIEANTIAMVSSRREIRRYSDHKRILRFQPTNIAPQIIHTVRADCEIQYRWSRAFPSAILNK